MWQKLRKLLGLNPGLVKKIVGAIAVSATLLFAQTAQAQTLHQYLTNKLGSYPTFIERAKLAAEHAIFNYKGTAEQNTLLVDRFSEIDKALTNSDKFGGTPVTGYSTTLSSSISSSATTIAVSSITTKDGHTLTAADIGNEIFLSLEAGSAREEITKCTGISGLTFTGCARGLAFYGNSMSEVTANKKAHNAGGSVIMSNVHYWYSPVTNTTSTVAIGNGATTSNKCVWAYNSRTPQRTICYNESTQKWVGTDDGTTSYNIADGGSGLTASSTKGIFVTDGKIGINASSTSGLGFHTDGYLQITPSSTSPIYADTNGLNVRMNSGSIMKNGSYQLTVVTSTTGLANTIPVGNSLGQLDSSWSSPQFTTSSLVTGEAIDGSVTPQAVAIRPSDGLVYKADGNDTTSVVAFGFITTNASISTKPTIVVSGLLSGFTGLTKGAMYYVADTAGSISTTPSTTTIIPIGRAISANQIQLHFGKKIAFATLAQSITSGVDGNNDQTVTVGFRPAIIRTSVKVCSAQAASKNYSEGYVIAEGTVFKERLTIEGAVNDSTAFNAGNIFTYTKIDVSANTILSPSITGSAGSDRATNEWSINSISDTGFVSRINFNFTANGGAGSVTTDSSFTFIAEE